MPPLTVVLLPVIAFLLGLLAFIGLPILARLPYVPSVADEYFRMSALCHGPMLLVLRETGTMNVDLCSADFDAERGVWQVDLDGETLNFEDPHDYLSRWQKQPFGIADERRGVIITPREAEIGKLVAQLRERTDYVETGGVGYQEGVVAVEKGSDALVDLTRARHIVTGSSRPSIPERTEEFTRLSQFEWNSTPVQQYMVWLGALGAGAFVVIVAAQLQATVGGGGGGISIGVPMIRFVGWSL